MIGNPGDRFKDEKFKVATKDVRKQTYKDPAGHIRVANVRDLEYDERLEMVTSNLPTQVVGRKTGFADFVARQAFKAPNRRQMPVQGGVVDDGIPMDMLEMEDRKTIKRAERLARGESGFANYFDQQQAKEAGDGYEFHEDQKLDNEEGGDAAGGNSGGNVGFSTTEHVDPEEQDFRDNKKPYGGNAVGASEKESKFKKPNPVLQDDDLEEGMILEAGEGQELTDHLQTEEVDDRSPQDQNEHNNVPEEPADAYVPNKGKGEDGMTDPLGDSEEFHFPSKGDWPLPGMSQNTQEHPTYQQINAKRIQMEDGRIYIGKLAGEDEEALYIQGVLLGSGMKKAAAFKLDKIDIVSARAYRPKPVLQPRVEKVADMYGQYDKTAKTITVDQARTMAKSLGIEGKDFERVFDKTKKKAEQVQEQDLVEPLGSPGDLALVQSIDGQMATVYFGGKRIEEIPMSQLHVVEKNAAENPSILKKFFGMKDDKTKVDREEIDEDRLAKTDKSTNEEGYLFGDDKALKDQLNKHEKEAAKIEANIKVLVEKSAEWDKAGKPKEAEALLVTAEEEQKKLANLNIKIAQIKQNFETTKTAGKSGSKRLFFQSEEAGTEGMFQ
jgi:hypothetical protein